MMIMMMKLHVNMFLPTQIAYLSIAITIDVIALFLLLLLLLLLSIRHLVGHEF